MLGTATPAGRVPIFFKLHGSVNWLYQPGSTGTDRIVLNTQHSTDWLLAEKRQPAPRDKYVFRGLAPLLVPPTGSKEAFYVNHALRAQWYDARTWGLASTRQIVVAGYSFPATDVTIRNMLTTEVFSHATPDITVLDRSRDSETESSVATALRESFPGRTRVKALGGATPIQDWVGRNCGVIVRYQHRQSQTGGHQAEVYIDDVRVEGLPDADDLACPYGSRDGGISATEWFWRTYLPTLPNIARMNVVNRSMGVVYVPRAP